MLTCVIFLIQMPQPNLNNCARAGRRICALFGGQEGIKASYNVSGTCQK
jgi:hypothetical protein